MRKQIIVLLLLSGVVMLGQGVRDGNLKTYVSKKGRCEIRYDNGKWHEIVSESKWDAEFGDPINLLSAYFIEFDNVVSEKHLKSMTNGQFRKFGKIRKFKSYKKQINQLIVDYLEFELNYKGKICRYQGLVYRGNGGSVELLFAGELEDMKKSQASIDEFSGGLSFVN